MLDVSSGTLTPSKDLRSSTYRLGTYAQLMFAILPMNQGHWSLSVSYRRRETTGELDTRG